MSSDHRRSWRPSDASSSGRISRYRSSTRTSNTDNHESDVPSHHHRRRFKRPSDSSSVSHRSPACRPSWAILSVAGAQRDDFPSDRTTSATALTTNGGEISVSFDHVEPPGISVLAVDPPRVPGWKSSSIRPDVLAAHRDVVLVKVYSATLSSFSTDDCLANYFVYHANSDPSQRLPSLSLLPVHYHEERSYKGRPDQILLCKDDTGIMSCRRKEGDNSFVVAMLSMEDIRVDMFWSGSGKWEVFKNLHVHGANGGPDLQYWSTDAVVADYGCRFLIWVDYYRGMILMHMSLPDESEEKNPQPPRLRYVPLPVDRVSGDPDDYEAGRGGPGHYRSVCATRYGIKFVSVDSKHCSNWGVGHMNVLTWNHTFRITTWSLREDDYTWRKDATMYEDEFLTMLRSEDHRFPRVTPEHPVVNMENPDAVCFLLKKSPYSYEEPTWMVEVDVKKKVLLTATAHTKTTSSSIGEKDAINSVRIGSHDLFFSTELPRYLDGGGQGCKRRRQ